MPTEPTHAQRHQVTLMKSRAREHWYTGTSIPTSCIRDLPAATTPELNMRLILTRDRMHHSVGWWRNADYECCWHLSMSAKSSEATGDAWLAAPYEEVPLDEQRLWAGLVFGEYTRWVWHEPGGTDPRLSREEQLAHRHILHLRLFIHHEPPHQPIYPTGEVYHLTRWVPGLTPEKVDR